MSRSEDRVFYCLEEVSMLFIIHCLEEVFMLFLISAPAGFTGSLPVLFDHARVKPSVDRAEVT